MSIEPRHVAEGAEARMRQLLSTLEVSRPVVPGLKRLAWDLTGPVRGAFPALQEALGQPGQVNLVSVWHGDPADAVRRDGVRLPARPAPAAVDGVPREGGRLLGWVEEAMGGPGAAERMAAGWIEARRRRLGRRGHGGAPDAAAEARAFGMALADAALGVPNAPSLGLPAGFAFSYYPTGEFMDDGELAFAEDAANVLQGTDTGLGRDDALFEAFRLLGRIERFNGSNLDGLAREEPAAEDAGALGYECARAALGFGDALARTRIPADLPPAFERVRATMAEQAPGPAA